MYEEFVCPCRPELWFWDSVVLLLTLALAASQVFATALDTYFQLTIMLMILTVGVTAIAHFQPFTDDLLQRMQVNAAFWLAHGTMSVASEPSVLGCIGEWTTTVCHEMPFSVSMLCKMCRAQGWLFLISTYVASLMLVPKLSTSGIAFCCKAICLHSCSASRQHC